MMKKQTFHCGGSSFELLTENGAFVGLGKVWIGKTLVRSGRLPMTVRTQTFTGMDLAGLKMVGVKAGRNELRIQTEARFRPLDVKLMRDHSFDPIHDLGDWDKPVTSGSGRLDLVIRPSRDRFNGVAFHGFAYHWEYQSKDTPLFYLMDMASWELGGNIAGATAVSQSACSAPVHKFDRKNSWSTEGILYFLVEQGGDQNPIMTHNLPRWASHGSFDFQYKGNHTLIGVFERLELIRSVLARDAGKPELKCFDKHIFDQSLRYKTVAKKILLNSDRRSAVGQQNVWTWVCDEVDRRARGEFGLKEEPFIPIIGQNFWVNFAIDSYFKDLLPAAAAVGCKRVFVDNLKRSCMTEKVLGGNMCGPHELEIAPELGGVVKLKEFVDRAKALGVSVISWTNNVQAISSPLNISERDDKKWFVLLEDARQKYGGAYMTVLSSMDLTHAAAAKYFVDSHLKIRKQTGLDAYLFDSFYNLAFMTVTYRDLKPRTQWRALLKVYKQLQDRGVHFTNESFGPFGRVQHGHPSSYNFQTMFACYKVGLGNDYTTVPTGQALKDVTPKSPAGVYYALAHMGFAGIPLFEDGKRIDAVWTDAHKQALKDYHAAQPLMHRRYLQEDGLSVWWKDESGRRTTVFNFKDRAAALPAGSVLDMTTGEKLPSAARHQLEANHTYVIAGLAPSRARK